MKKTLLASLALMLGWGGTAFAQTEVDALRYSQMGISGTARIQGMGGAQTALGADISSLSGNPAGLGMFRRSEFTVTPGIQSFNNNTSILGERNTSSNSNFVFPQLGVVVSKRKGDDDLSEWRGLTFGVGFTRLNNFNERYTSYRTQSGETDPTIVEYFADLAAENGRTRASLDNEYDAGITTLEGLGYGAYLFDVNEDGEIFATERVGRIAQREEIIRKGAQNQIDIGVGTSYKDRLYIGASLGIVTVDYSQESIYTEAEGEPSTSFTSLEYVDEFSTSGAGVNLKVGLIARPIDALRFGLSIQTPTAYTFDDDYQRRLSTTFDDGVETAAEVPGQFSYRLVTPFRATGGVAVFAGKYGFITADVEFVNYGKAKYREDDDFSSGGFFDDINEGVANNNSSAVNYRIGAEGRYEVFRVRAGYAYNADPEGGSSYDAGFINYKYGPTHNYTFGVGIRLQNFYVDAAYVHSQQNTDYAPFVSGTSYSPYSLRTTGEPMLNIDRKQSSALLTLGFNF
ncbi:hypothetical protein POKO110462_01560 [Pontibacter korlensis]|uniref:Aromatic hydrocarbon degradation membrane protein n=1 Tax=Pontibacter korlensis TaxID=400092 RepID=A0A0E3ZEI9_9BACT|nr:hypothetical protein [Pontibacter korlensis]AKD02924.1 hypothetical protein PKOR_07035 [Pontibacter korlensis]